MSSLRKILRGVELLAALCDISAVGFAVVAEVSAESSTARAVLDRINLGIVNGSLRAVVADTLAANPNRVILANIAFDDPVDCDAALIQALATNLLNNALAHGAPTGPVSFIASTHDNDLEIAVWHHGNVITNRRAARQALLDCEKIVRAHLGTIDVTSSPTEGTQFVARIPVVRSLRLH